MIAYRRSRDIAPIILNLGARWRWVVNVTSRSLYPPPGKKLGIFEHKAGWTPGTVWMFRRTDVLPLLDLPARSVVATPTHMQGCTDAIKTVMCYPLAPVRVLWTQLIIHKRNGDVCRPAYFISETTRRKRMKFGNRPAQFHIQCKQ
jgi:hypothetical protein